MAFKTPGVYISPQDTFSTSVVEVDSAVPAFVGYTQKALSDGKSLARKPRRIASMAEYQALFGGPSDAGFILHDCMDLFFLNGGENCYIVSVGDYSAVAVGAAALTAGIDLLLMEQEPTLLVVPEAVLLDEPACAGVQQAMLVHCGEQMRNRVAVLDIRDGSKSRTDGADCVAAFRERIGDRHLSYAAAYYPWLNTAASGKPEKWLPPSAAMAGVYTRVDHTRGVWNAPAGISLAGVTAPSVAISSQEQEALNAPPETRSINAIHSFVGEGFMVWGARTLDGESPDWRYISVRRTLIMVEESCRLAMLPMVFEPNMPATWLRIKTMLEAYLNELWKRGGLLGATPADAFRVCVGLGETMTADDILEGSLRVVLQLAAARPAEFIVVTFVQQMQQT